MSDLGIFIIAPLATAVTPVAPWTYRPDPIGGTGGWLELRLTAGKTGGAGWVPGYIPRESALPEIDLAVDLEAGGDAEQLRTITLWIADQLSDGQIMSTWLRDNGVTLAGASIQLFAAAPIAGYPYPQPLWTGLIRQPRITLTRLGLPCESPLDSDPLGEIVSDSSIRPIVYGAASKVKLPALPIAEDVISTLVQGVAAPVEGETIPPTRAVLTDSAAAGVVLTATNPVSQESYITLAYGLNAPDITPWFPGNVVPDTNDWYIEIIAGKGAGQVRRLKAGSAVEITASGLAVPYPLMNINQLAAVRATEWTRQIRFVIDLPFQDLGATELLIQGTYKRTYNPDGSYVDTWQGGEEVSGGGLLYYETPGSYNGLRDYYIPRADRSYARVVRKGRSFALPVHSGFASQSPLFARSDSQYIQINNAEDLFRIEGGVINVIPSADSMDSARCYTRLDPAWPQSKVLAESVADTPANPLISQLPRIFGGSPGTDAYENRFRIAPTAEVTPFDQIPTWTTKNHLTIAIANPGWDLSGVEDIYLCAEVRWYRTDSDTTDIAVPRMDLVALRPSPLEAWWYPPFQAGLAWEYRATLPENPPPQPYELIVVAGGEYVVQSIPPGLSDRPGPLYRWPRRALKIANVNKLEKALAGVLIVIGAHRMGAPPSASEKHVGIEVRQLMLLASRTVNLSEIYVDINGPTYGTDTALTNWNKRVSGDSLYGWPAVPLTSGLSTADPIADHAHAVEDIFRRHAIAPFMVNPVDGAAVEQAYVDLNSKTQTSLSLLPAASRPRLSVGFTEAAPQVGDVVAQLCRDGMLVGSRNGRGQRTLKAWLARSLLTEFDAEILESDLYRDSISEAPASPLSKLISAPLIRYGQQGGAPAYYVQVTRPDAAAWQADYTIGFQRTADAQRAWQICHRGWMESGVAQAREIRMDTVPDYDSLMALTLAPRGTTFFDWISRPKRRLAPQVGLDHPAALLPRGSRVKLHHWRYAPGGAWGTLVRAKLSTQNQVATLELMMDLDP